MKNAFILSSAMMLNTILAQAQFEKIYVGGGSPGMVELNHNTLCGYHGSSSGPGMSLLDTEGNVVETNTFVQYPFIVPMEFKKADANTIYFTSGYVAGSCNGGYSRMYPVVGKMDTLGKVLALSRYELTGACESLALDLEVTHDKGVVTWGWQHDFFALRVDSNLNHVWSKHLSHHGHFQFIKELPGGDLLAGFNMDTAGAAVARLNANGDFLWCKSYMRPAGSMNDCIIESDSSFVITGLTDVAASPGQRLFMMKLNGDGEVQWCRGYSTGNAWYGEQPLRMVRTQDNNYVLIAINGGRPFLAKTNLNGDTLWTRSFGVQGYNYETGDLLQRENGSYLFSGIINGPLPDMNTGLPYIFNTDTLGYLPCTPDHSLPLAITELFPVDSSFTLDAFVEGAPAFPGSVIDTTYAPITVYDGCTVTGMSILPQRTQPRIRPNPSTGHFTVSFTDPLTADSFYSVYDATGRLLLQRPLSTGSAEVQMDLSRYGKGMYLVRFSDRNGVCNERVVVE